MKFIIRAASRDPRSVSKSVFSEQLYKKIRPSFERSRYIITLLRHFSVVQFS